MRYNVLADKHRDYIINKVEWHNYKRQPMTETEVGRTRITYEARYYWLNNQSEWSSLHHRDILQVLGVG